MGTHGAQAILACQISRQLTSTNAHLGRERESPRAFKRALNGLEKKKVWQRGTRKRAVIVFHALSFALETPENGLLGISSLEFQAQWPFQTMHLKGVEVNRNIVDGA